MTFTTPLAPGDHAYFALEAALTTTPPNNICVGESLCNDRRLALHWAPVHFQDTAKTYQHSDKIGPFRADYLAPIDYDGDWDTTDNFDHLIEPPNMPLHATVYYSVVESETHWYIVYAFYHPWDSHSPHENDLEGALFIVSKDDPSPFGRLDAIVTVDHDEFRSFRAEGSPFSDLRAHFKDDFTIRLDESTGRPQTHQDARTHALTAYDPGKKPFSGIRYEPKEGQDEFSCVGDVPTGGTGTVRYCLVNIFAPAGLWDHRLDFDTFLPPDQTDQAHPPGTFRGSEDDGHPNRAHAPWAWDDKNDGDARQGGELAMDPANLTRAYFRHSNESGFYVRNQYRDSDHRVFVANIAEGNDGRTEALSDKTSECHDNPTLCRQNAASEGRLLRNDEIVSAVRRTSPEVVMLNEVCGYTFDQLAGALAPLGYQGRFGKASAGGKSCRDFTSADHPLTGYGNAAFVRTNEGITFSETILLGTDLLTGQPRVMECVQYEGRMACAVHLTPGVDADCEFGLCFVSAAATSREAEVAEVIENATRFIDLGPTVVGGDFNMRGSGNRFLAQPCTDPIDGCLLGRMAVPLPEHGENHDLLHSFGSSDWLAYFRTELYGGEALKLRSATYDGVKWTDHPNYMVQQYSSAVDDE